VEILRVVREFYNKEYSLRGEHGGKGTPSTGVKKVRSFKDDEGERKKDKPFPDPLFQLPPQLSSEP